MTAMIDYLSAHGATKIPICDNNRGEKDRVVFYPDELPEDHQVLSDVLRAVFAPFKVWRNVALEYHRQGFDAQCENLLTEIVSALEDPDIDKLYQEQDKDDYSEGIVDIYVALAAKALSNYCRAKRSDSIVQQTSAEFAKKLVEYLKIVDEKQRLNEYTWLIRGFFEISRGDFKRAEDHFRYAYDRAAKSQSALKKKYLFGAVVGLGVVSYVAQKYELALSHFVKAVQTNQEASGASVRIALALCCFKLEQYDRARMALEKSLSIDPTNSDALVLMALVEQAIAKKDRVKRTQCHAHAYEYCSIAHMVNPSNPQVLNLLASHHFHSWRAVEFSVGGCLVASATQILVPAQAAPELLVPQNLLRLRGLDASTVYTITAVYRAEGDLLTAEKVALLSGRVSEEELVVLEVSPRISQQVLSACALSPFTALEIKDLASVERFAHQAILHASLPAIVAESNYILGKVAHSLRDSNLAFDFYWKALKDAPDMTLAAFGAAQILFSRKEFQASLELFEKVLMKSPEDKDTQAYVMYLKAIMRRELAQFEKLREIAPGFQHEAELWLLQGQLRQHDPKHALKCFINAKECIEQRAVDDEEGKPVISPAILSNIAVLHHSLGKLPKAIEYTSFRSSELDGVFYSWSAQPVCALRAGSEAGHFALVEVGSVNLSDMLETGDEVVIGEVKHSVVQVISPSELICTSPVKLLALSKTDTFEMKLKQPMRNFDDDSLTYCYNFARLMEDDGNTKAASEIYVELLKRHPSYMECYLRLSLICCELGNFDDASMWLSRAVAVREDAAEATLCLGDLYHRNGNLEDAKKCYDKICSANKHDSKAMLSLGNFYCTYSSGAKADSQLKESYKFFYHVLNENNNNAFAANGLGMVCAKKQELDVARETFSKARESNVAMSEDICTNLAHIYALQHRGVEAERLYQATIKSLSKSGRSVADRPAYLHECVALVQHKSRRFNDAGRSVLRAMHLNPTNMRSWYNLALTGLGQGEAILAKGNSSAAVIEDAMLNMLLSKKVFKHLSAIQHAPGSSKPYDRKNASTNYTSVSVKLQNVGHMLKSAKSKEDAEESEKRRREDAHQLQLQNKSQMKEIEAQKSESAKLVKQQLAEQKERKLQELREKWTVSVVEKAASRSKANKESGTEEGSKKRRRGPQKQGGSEGIELNDEEESDEEDEALMRVLNSKEDIDFGSSEDESASTGRSLRPRTAPVPASATNDLFGEESDDEAEQHNAPARKKLKRGTTAGAADSDSDAVDFDEGAEQGGPKPRKQQRIMDEDSD